VATAGRLPVADNAEVFSAGAATASQRHSSTEVSRVSAERPTPPTSNLIRDLEDAAETYPDEHWPVQVQRSLRGLIHAVDAARDADPRDPRVDPTSGRAAVGAVGAFRLPRGRLHGRSLGRPAAA
jgi:hypothetical protein